MAADVNIIHCPGSLYLNPTGTAIASRGTYLGYTEYGFALSIDREMSPIVVSEHGSIPQDFREIDCGIRVAVALTYWNTTTKILLFGDSRVHSTGRVEIPGNVTGGTSATPHRMLFVPSNESSTTNNNMYCAWVAHNAIARIMPGESIDLSLSEKSVFPLEIHCVPAACTSTAEDIYNYRSFGMGSVGGLSVNTNYPA